MVLAWMGDGEPEWSAVHQFSRSKGRVFSGWSIGQESIHLRGVPAGPVKLIAFESGELGPTPHEMKAAVEVNLGRGEVLEIQLTVGQQ
jgi:hypothetical protein